MADSSDNSLPCSSGAEPPKLSDLLDRGWKVFEEVEATAEPLGSSAVQLRVKRGIALLEEATAMAAQLDLFSRNEELEEVATADLKYLLLPALLGALTMKLTGRDKRLGFVRAARAYFLDFLRRCKEYHLARFELPAAAEEDAERPDTVARIQPAAPAPDLVAMAAQRQNKLERYRQRKELETRLSAARAAVERGDADEEVSRDFYLLSVRRWVTLSLEEVESIDQEVEILKNMGDVARAPPPPARPPMKPFILTKDALQARVFGAGYPSLATMTVDDWYEQRRRHGQLPDQGEPRRVAAEEEGATDAQDAEDEDKEKKVEEDDEEALTKARNWDDWKDDHRRGYGNRHNMG